MSKVVIMLVAIVSLLVCWALAELRYEGWKKRKRRIILLLALAIAVQLAAWKIVTGS